MTVWDDGYYEDEHEGYGEEFGCCMPDRCLMPGRHYPSECHDIQMMEAADSEHESENPSPIL